MSTAAIFFKKGFIYMKHTTNMSKKVGMRRFRCFFGITPSMCKIVWELLRERIPLGAEPKHLLWGLNFLKQYDTEHVRRVIFNSDEKTIRKWSWIFIKLIADLNVVYLYKNNWVLKINSILILIDKME